MKVLIAGSLQHEIYAKAFCAAFRRLGHEVVSFNPDDYICGGPLKGPLEKVKRHWLVGPAITKASKDLVRKVQEFNPELVFLFHCYFFLPSAVKKISEKTIVLSYENDDPFDRHKYKPNPSFYLDAAKYCKINYVFRRKNVEDFARMGIDNAKVLLPYYLETRNFPIPCEKNIPIALVGHFEDDGRDHMIKALMDAGLPVELYGSAANWAQSILWPDLQSIFFGPALGDNYNKVLNRTQVALVFFSRSNHDTYTYRSFEIPAAKTLMLSEYTEDMDSFWPEDECCVYFRSKEELVHKAAWLLDHPEERQRIATNAFERLKALGCSETDRVREILADYDALARGKNPLSES